MPLSDPTPDPEGSEASGLPHPQRRSPRTVIKVSLPSHLRIRLQVHKTLTGASIAETVEEALGLFFEKIGPPRIPGRGSDAPLAPAKEAPPRAPPPSELETPSAPPPPPPSPPGSRPGARAPEPKEEPGPAGRLFSRSTSRLGDAYAPPARRLRFF